MTITNTWPGCKSSNNTELAVLMIQGIVNSKPLYANRIFQETAQDLIRTVNGTYDFDDGLATDYDFQQPQRCCLCILLVR